MNPFSIMNKFRIVLRIVGWLVVVAGIAAGLVWFFVLTPWLKATQPEWTPDRSLLGLWKDRQRMISVFGWSHDDGIYAGQFGDPEMVPDLVQSMVRGDGISCAGGHREAGLAFLTNHPGPEDWSLGEYWQKWWTQHQNETQEQWFQAGFAEQGVAVHLPPDLADAPALLRVLGSKAPTHFDSPPPEEVSMEETFAPEFLRFNAFRWLRDSGFDPVEFLLKREGSVSEEEAKGLREFQYWKRWSQTAVPGRLAFAPSDDWGWGIPNDRKPQGLTPSGNLWIGGILLSIIVIGLLLLMGARWMRSKLKS